MTLLGLRSLHEVPARMFDLVRLHIGVGVVAYLLFRAGILDSSEFCISLVPVRCTPRRHLFARLRRAYRRPIGGLSFNYIIGLVRT